MSCYRLVSSLKQNLTYYLSIAVAGLVGIGLLLISGSLHAGDLLPLAMLLSNTYGELTTDSGSNLGWDANSLVCANVLTVSMIPC